MRHDGTYVIYEIQHEQIGDNRWEFSNLDYFGYPEGFNASGRCYQETGIHGSFDYKEAKTGLKWLRKKHKDRKFRLVCVITVQKTIIMNNQFGWR